VPIKQAVNHAIKMTTRRIQDDAARKHTEQRVRESIDADTPDKEVWKALTLFERLSR